MQQKEKSGAQAGFRFKNDAGLKTNGDTRNYTFI